PSGCARLSVLPWLGSFGLPTNGSCIVTSHPVGWLHGRSATGYGAAAMTATMLCSAFDNSQSDRIAYPSAAVESDPVLQKVFGDRLIAVEDIARKDLRAAMNAYAERTD